MFSIMITVESTTMPKSTAPKLIKFADVPIDTMPMNAISSASGMLIAVTSAPRKLPRNSSSNDDHEAHADDEVLEHGVRRQVRERAAVVVRLDRDALLGRQHVLADVLEALLDGIERALRLSRRAAHQHDALHDVVVVVLADDAVARHPTDEHVGDIAHAHRRTALRDDHDVADILLRYRLDERRLGLRADQADAAHGERLLAHLEPLTADVLVRVGDRGGQLRERRATALEPIRIDVDADTGFTTSRRVLGVTSIDTR